ncbi:MAG: precorrin-3B synthase [Rhodospirillaceae bacterium]|nr:precorrin-3B synthase [Rhodospirillaceae bacterium]
MVFAGDKVTDRSSHSADPADQIAGDGSNRRFACPGLFRIVPSRDGGICRIKLPRGLVTASQVRAIAETAAGFAGAVEATNRSNIQIRGVRGGCEDAVIAAVTAAGLGPRTAGADDVRNVMVSPAAGIDPAALVDVTDLADRILARLEVQSRYHALSPKFSIQIDGGESTAMLEHPNDIWFAAVDSTRFAFGFAGCPGDVGGTVGTVAADEVEATLFALLDRFLAENGKINSAGTVISRFRHLLVDQSADAIAASLPISISRHGIWQRRQPVAFGHIGQQAQRQRDLCWLGAVPPVGRLSARMLHGLADLADNVSGSEIRMTPWQSVFLPNVALTSAASALGQLAALGFVVKSDRAFAGLVTCAGSAGCKSGFADTKSDALALGNFLDACKVEVVGLHLTGCGKSCAAPRTAPVTLLGISPGHYDVFLRSDAEKAGFGKLVGRNLTIEQAGSFLADKFSRVPE